MPIAPRGCTACPPGTSPHRAAHAIRYRRGELQVLMPVCDRTAWDEITRLLEGDDVRADVAPDAEPVRVVRLVPEPVGGTR